MRRESHLACHREAAAATHVHPLAREEEDRRPANQEAVPVRPVPRGAPHREASRRAQPAGPRAAEQLEPAQADRLPRRPAPAREDASKDDSVPDDREDLARTHELS